MSEIVREATWLTTEESELLIARQEGTVISPAFFRRGKVQTAIVSVAGLLLLAAIRFTTASPANYHILLFAVSGMSLGLIPIVVHWERRQAAARAGDAELREGFGRGSARFVSLIIRQGEAPTGEDRGLLWFEDGRMYFSGHRTSFGLIRSQMRGYSPLLEAIPKVRNPVNVELDRDTPAGPMSLSFGLFLPPEANVRVRHAELKGEIDRWRSVKVAQEDDGQWPPSTLGPLVISERRLLIVSLVWTFALPVPTFILLGSIAWYLALAAYLIAVFVLGSVLAKTVRCRWLALRDRRRLRERR